MSGVTVPGANRIAEYLRLNSDVTAAEALGATGADPSTWGDVLEDALSTRSREKPPQNTRRTS